MFTALLLVVAVLGNSANRTAINAFSAAAIGEKETIGPVVGIGPGGRFNGYSGHYRSCPHGFAFGGDEPVAQTESTQTGGMSGMAF